MSEYLSGEELWDKFDAAYRRTHAGESRTPFGSIATDYRIVWEKFAAELKIPRPKVPTLKDAYEEWQKTVGWTDENGDLEQLRQRLNAAHEAKERKP